MKCAFAHKRMPCNTKTAHFGVTGHTFCVQSTLHFFMHGVHSLLVLAYIFTVASHTHTLSLSQCFRQHLNRSPYNLCLNQLELNTSAHSETRVLTEMHIARQLILFTPAMSVKICVCYTGSLTCSDYFTEAICLE